MKIMWILRLVVAVAIAVAIVIYAPWSKWWEHTTNVFDVAQSIMAIASFLWLLIGFATGRFIGIVRRARWNAKKKRITWRWIGFALQWRLGREYHGTFINETLTRGNAEKHGERTQVTRTRGDSRYYVTIAGWIRRTGCAGQQNLLKVCGETFRVFGMTASSPVRAMFDLDISDNQNELSLAECWELRDQLGGLHKDVFDMEKEDRLQEIDSEQLVRRHASGSMVICKLTSILPHRYQPQYADVTKALREQGSSVTKKAIEDNEKRIDRHLEEMG